eukprot:TRINITY_DN1856_c0_g1_i1.p1 TRINITY_DN1856_c0_g1~~TRINITY_DN1856_c0_g1_i1.p1  ORF type:complete len:224 (+),score=37.79 TRINITY_DN1856_c0_g1_i1:94-672(+)
MAEELSYDQKHPLQDRWVWWYDLPRGKARGNTWVPPQQIYTFSSVEDFWSLWNNIKGAHELQSGSNYHIFKEGIAPTWEDKSNALGGKWVHGRKSNQSERSNLNDVWLRGVLGCIGGGYSHAEELCGIVVSVRKRGDKIALWTKSCDNEEICLSIGREFKSSLETDKGLSFQAHQDALRHDSSFNNEALYKI